ncbi:esterase family protein [bacterium]|nr:esterase family protein [bacterium]
MKLIRLLTVLILSGLCAGNAQTSRGTVYEGLTVESRLLGKDVRYTVYLPFDYDTSSRYYPVVYLLHGYTDDDTGWLQFGEANLIADDAIASREIPPMILVMPDAGVSWYMNNYDGSVPYEDFFFQEFIPYIESAYRIRTDKRYRGVAGLSMGGKGALLYAMKHPDMFCACGAFSAAIRTAEQISGMTPRRWQQVEEPVHGRDRGGDSRISSHLLANNILHLAATLEAGNLASVRWYIDCGDDDSLSLGNALLHIRFKERGVLHEFRVRDGGHRWSYWRSGLKDALQFIGASFHQE